MRPGGGHSFSGSHVSAPHFSPHIEPHISPHIEPHSYVEPHFAPHIYVRPTVVHHHTTIYSDGDSGAGWGAPTQPDSTWPLLALVVFVSVTLLFIWHITK